VKLERGFRRIVIALSLLLVALGVTLDVTSPWWPHATVQVTLRDGRKITLERHEPTREALTHRG